MVLVETDKGQARFVAERIRQTLELKRIKVYDEELRVTISIGIAAFPEDAGENQLLMDKADEALYRAKETGRNRICIYGQN